MTMVLATALENSYSILLSFINVLIGDFPGVEMSASGALITLRAALVFIRAITLLEFSPFIFFITLNFE